MKMRAAIILGVFLLSQVAPVYGFSATDKEGICALQPNDTITLSLSYVQEGDSESIFSRALSSHFLIGYDLPLLVHFPSFPIPTPPRSHVTVIPRHIQLRVLRN
jgi:hypothetical protein